MAKLVRRKIVNKNILLNLIFFFYVSFSFVVFCLASLSDEIETDLKTGSGKFCEVNGFGCLFVYSNSLGLLIIYSGILQ